MSHRVGGRLPAGALGSAGLAVGRVVASAVRTGEILTDVRLVGTSSLTGLPAGLVAVPVRVADAESVGYFQTGDLVDLLAAGIADTASGRVVASAVRVLAVSPRPASGPAGTFGTAGSAGTFRAAGGSGAGALILVAVSPDSALRLAAAAVNDRISVVLRHY